MADTIVNTPAPSSDSGAGWMVAVVILIAVLLGGFYLYRSGVGRAAAPDTTNINVSVPNPLDSGGDAGAGSGQ